MTDAPDNLSRCFKDIHLLVAEYQIQVLKQRMMCAVILRTYIIFFLYVWSQRWTRV